MPPSELLVIPSFDFLAKLEHQRLLNKGEEGACAMYPSFFRLVCKTTYLYVLCIIMCTRSRDQIKSKRFWGYFNPKYIIWKFGVLKGAYIFRQPSIKVQGIEELAVGEKTLKSINLLFFLENIIWKEKSTYSSCSIDPRKKIAQGYGNVWRETALHLIFCFVNTKAANYLALSFQS